MLLDGHTVRMGSSQLAGHIKRSATREVADIGVHGKNIWRTAAPTKVKCFTWLVVRKTCLTHEVLRKKKIIIPWCSLCGKTGETNSHLTYSYIVLSQHKYVPCFSTIQKWNGVCPNIQLIYLVVGSGEEVARDKRPIGIWFHIAFCGQCGRRGIVGILKIYPIQFTRLNGIALYLFFFGVRR